VLQLIRNNSPYTVIILFIFTLLVKMQALIHPLHPAMLPDYLLYNSIINLFDMVFNGNGAAFAYTLFAVLLLFFQALYLNRICNKYKLFPKSTYIPAFTYILLTSIYVQFSYFNETILVLWCVLGAIDTFLAFGQTLQPRKHIFNAGFMLCLAALFQFSAIGYFALLVMCMIVLRPFNFGEWVVAMAGYITPIYFFASVLFLIDMFREIVHWPNLGVSLPGRMESPVYMLGTFSGLIILFFSGVYVMQQQIPKSSIYVRRNWLALLIYVLISIAVAIITDAYVKSVWLILMPGLTLIISHALSLEKSKRFSNFIFYFSLIFVVFCQLAQNK